MTTHRNVFLFIAIFACATFAGILGASSAHADGSQTYSTPGTYSFTVPSYATLTVQVWGGGGGGGAQNSPYSSIGSDGGQSSFAGTVIANGGGAGAVVETGGSTPSPGGAGGTASGGTINTTGSNGVSTSGVWSGPGGAGGSSPNGGTGGAGGATGGSSPGSDGGAPGGGGGGASAFMPGSGGGGGGYSSITYTTGQLTVGGGISIVVGAGGSGSPNPTYAAGTGASGQVSITYTSPLVRIIRLRGHIRLKGNIRLAGVTPVTTASPCAGTRYGGYCWYFSPASGSCTTACATHGSCNLAGITAYGSSGNEAMCTALLTAMGAPAPGYAFYDASWSTGIGCGYQSYAGITWFRDTPVTSCAADNAGLDSFVGSQTYRACSCIN